MSKTRALLVDVARRLFAQKGVNETTMNDIATASGKGRRTLYTYFRSKEDVYKACIESELSIVTTALLAVMKQDLSPREKLEAYIRVHFEVFKDIVIRNGNLHSVFFQDIVEVEKVRNKMDKRETVMIHQILEQGVEQGVFFIQDIKRTAQILLYALKGLEVPYTRENIRGSKERNQQIFEFLFYGLVGIGKDHQNN
jgi:AcrR family transcriptional regulator